MSIRQLFPVIFLACTSSSTSAGMPAEPKRKPRTVPKPYNRTAKTGPKPKAVATHKSSAKPPLKAQEKHENLTYGDWLEVFAWVDEHPAISQMAIVRHFSERADGPLLFTQGTLSRKLKARETIEHRAQANPAALSSKRPRVVTRPDVERALVIWQRQMESKGQTVNRAMLVEKRSRFEKELDVPEEECVKGEGWISSFCQTCVHRAVLMCALLITATCAQVWHQGDPPSRRGRVSGSGCSAQGARAGAEAHGAVRSEEHAQF